MMDRDRRVNDRPVIRFAAVRTPLIRSFIAVTVAVPALVAAFALPAQASAVSSAPQTSQNVETGTQGYPTTSLAELQAAAAPDSTTVTVASSGNGNYMHDADAPWIRPVTARVTSPYGPRRIICNDVGCSSSFHDGIDFGSSCGTPIKAISPGRVTFAGYAGSFGQRVIIDHGAGLASIYGHALTGSIKVAVGQQVVAGTVVASVGATGVVTGCHLDLKIRVGGVYVDPAPFLTARGIVV